MLSVLLRYTDSDYPFGIVKLFESFTVATMTWFTVTEYLCPNDNGYVPFVVITIVPFLIHDLSPGV